MSQKDENREQNAVGHIFNKLSDRFHKSQTDRASQSEMTEKEDLELLKEASTSTKQEALSVLFGEQEEQESSIQEETAGTVSQERLFDMDRWTKLASDCFEKGYNVSYLVGAALVKNLQRAERTVSRGFSKGCSAVWSGLKSAASHLTQWVGRKADGLAQPFRTTRRELQRQRELLSGVEEQSVKMRLQVTMASAGAVCKLSGRILARVLNYAAPVAGCLVLAYTVNYFTNLQFGLEVEYSGNVIGVIQDESVFELADKQVKERIIYEEYDKPVDSVPRFTLCIIDEEDYTPVSQLTDKIIEASGNEITEASGLYIDGEFRGATVDPDSLTQALDGILESYRGDDPTARAEFVRPVTISEGLYPVSSVVDFDDIEDVLSEEVEGERIYTVEEGDAPLSIAAKNDVPYSELKAMNPGIEDSLLIGQQVLIAQSERLLGVKVTKKITYEESIPYTTNTTTDDNYAKSYSKVTQEGQEGIRQVSAEVTYKNGIEVVDERVILSTTVIKEPVTKEITVGTKKTSYSSSIPGSTGSGTISGSFIWPVAGGYVSCYYGGYPGHTGQDIAAPSGTNIFASASGKVIGMTNSWPYGKSVLIDHGNGVRTRYAHCSALYVSIGDYVSQGQVIAAVGRTGNASGNHCHFELIINGVYRNPRGYIGG